MSGVLGGKKRHDYDISYKRSVNQLASEKLSAEKAIPEVDEMVEGYFADTGEMPSVDSLENMADIILGDDLREKTKTLEYGILSDHQIRRINSRSGEYREVPFDVTEVDCFYYIFLEPSLFVHPLLPQEYFSPLENKSDFKILRRNGQEDSRYAWAIAVKRRDCFRCQNPTCKSRTGIMNAHHIENYADNPDKRTDVSNGITLCETCHVDFHIVYGKSNNTSEQLAEFMRVDNEQNEAFVE